MKLATSCVLFACLCVACSPSANARQIVQGGQQTRAYRKAAKKAQKDMAKYSKQQRKAMKKSAKAQKKALKRAQRNNPRY